MNVDLLIVKTKLRLNKLDSSDYDNIEPQFIIEAYNKVQREWVRRQLYGANQYKESSEQTKHKVNDLQILLKKIPIIGKNTLLFFETDELPKDLLKFENIKCNGKTKECKVGKSIYINFIEEANVDTYLKDWALKPSFEWASAFNTVLSNKVRIYHNNEFEVVTPATITYYRQPRDISMDGIEDINGIQHGDIDPEFSDDIVELLIDETVMVLASDIESFNVLQTSEKRKEFNN